MTKIKIIDLRELTLKQEEDLMNTILSELESSGHYITRIEYRKFSNVIEYTDFIDDNRLECNCNHCEE